MRLVCGWVFRGYPQGSELLELPRLAPGFAPLQVTGPLHGWRCRAKLAVRGRPGKPVIGLFKRGSHDVVDIVPGCKIHHPRINQAAALIKQVGVGVKDGGCGQVGWGPFVIILMK